MTYDNSDISALLAMELERLGNYGDYDDTAQKCPVCGAEAPEYFYLNEDEECIGCSHCVYRADFLEEM